MKSFWAGKKVLITGHTGFKGSWLTYYLLKQKAEVCGIGLEPENKTSLYNLLNITNLIDDNIVDITNYDLSKQIITNFQPDIVIHMAAQAFVREGYSNPIKTYNSNIMGTVNVLDSLRSIDSIRVGIFITTDKVYKEQILKKPYKENDLLGGKDPYSASKSASELIIDSYKESFLNELGISISTARAGNVIGGGDWSKDRIIPDAVKNWSDNKILSIRNPDASRPWQHVLEPLNSYLKLAELTWDNNLLSGHYNFGPDADEIHTVKNVVSKLKTHFTHLNPKIEFQKLEDNYKESDWLALDNTKSRENLGIEPVWNFEECINIVGNWYSNFYKGISAEELCDIDISKYEKKINA